MPQEVIDRRPGLARVAEALIWLGGGHGREAGECHERSAHAVAGAVVMLGAALAWLVAALAVGGPARATSVAVVPLTVVFGLLAGAVTRATVPGPHRSRPGLVGRAAMAAAVGVIVGELATSVILSGSIDQRLDERAARAAESAPAVAQASASLQRTKEARAALERAVTQARDRQDGALVVARCEYHPTPVARRPGSPAFPAPGPKPARATSFSTTQSMNSTPRCLPGTAARRRWMPRSRDRSKTCRMRGAASSPTPAGAWVHGGSR